MKKVSIDPITRLEGHGKIDIFLNDKGEVVDAHFQVPELRGFEVFCKGQTHRGYAHYYQQNMRGLPRSPSPRLGKGCRRLLRV